MKLLIAADFQMFLHLNMAAIEKLSVLNCLVETMLPESI